MNMPFSYKYVLDASANCINDINELLSQHVGELVVMTTNVIQNYSESHGFYERKFRKNINSVKAGIIKNSSVIVGDYGEIFIPTTHCLGCDRINTYWDEVGDNRIGLNAGTNLSLFQACGSGSALLGELKRNMRKIGDKFEIYFSCFSGHATNTIIIGDRKITSWQSSDKNKDYLPLIFLMSHIMDHPLDGLLSSFKEVLNEDASMSGNIGIILTYYLETLYRRQGNFMSTEVLDRLLELLPESTRQSNVGQLTKSSLGEMGGMIIGGKGIY